MVGTEEEEAGWVGVETCAGVAGGCMADVWLALV